MGGSSKIRIVIVGAGTVGSSLLELLKSERGVEVIGITDIDPQAPGLRLAELLGIPHDTDTRDFLARQRPDLIINATNDPAMETDLQHKPEQAEVLSQMASRLLWGLAQHERELRDHLIQTEKLATIGTLASGISHEINNPLYIMMGFSEHIRDETRDDGIRKYADAILEAGHRIANIVRDLNIFAQQPRSETLDDVDINQSLTEAVKIARRTTIQDDVSVVARYGPVTPVRGRPDEILQLFLNLVTNAVQAMDGRGTLTLTTRSSDGYILATVKDTGPGIPRDHLARIFDPFFTTKEQGKGTGLGLHIVREIVRGYGGEVTVESTLGEGAVFTVKLPSPAGSPASTR
jgi:two-component system NtrC family sensor kinase